MTSALPMALARHSRLAVTIVLVAFFVALAAVSVWLSLPRRTGR